MALIGHPILNDPKYSYGYAQQARAWQPPPPSPCEPVSDGDTCAPVLAEDDDDDARSDEEAEAGGPAAAAVLQEVRGLQPGGGLALQLCIW